MKVKDIMAADSIKFCSPETRLHNAAKVMKDVNCGALPVVDKNKKLIGMVTDRDICLSLATKRVKLPAHISVGQIMTTKIVSVKPDDDISVALNQMRTKKVGRLPVINSDGKLEGVLTMHQLLAYASRNGDDFNDMYSGETIAKTIKALSNRYSEKRMELEAIL